MEIPYYCFKVEIEGKTSYDIYSSSDKQPVQKYDLLVCPDRQGPKKETSQKRVKRYRSFVFFLEADNEWWETKHLNIFSHQQWSGEIWESVALHSFN